MSTPNEPTPQALFSGPMQSALVFAARYTHTRNTGGTLAVVRALEQCWHLLDNHTREQILGESQQAEYNIDDWQRLIAFAEKTAATAIIDREMTDTAPEQWRSQCLVARIQRDAALASLQMAGWQPIETAPKDGLLPLALWDGATVTVGARWEGSWTDWLHDWMSPQPTHWQDLPSPPQ